jgi:ribonuclease HI
VSRRPSRQEILAVIAEVEGLDRTLSRFPGLRRDELLEILGHAAPPKPAPRPNVELKGLVLHTDGASRGNPGPAAIGVVLATPDGKVVESIAKTIGRTTNNVAEYEAVRAGLARARELGARSVLLRADSELVVRQLSGQYQVKNPGLRPIYEDVKRIERTFEGGVRYQHVRRELNVDADALANAALDQESEAR